MSTHTILLVDDVEDNLDLLREIFEDETYDIFIARDGAQALQAIRNIQPDVILLDVLMPQIDGIEVCRRLKADPELETIPVLMISALGQDHDVIRGLEAGAQDYISKPFSAPIVRAHVRAALRGKANQDMIRRMNERLAEMCNTAHEFVDNVSHEFRTPLTVIREFASIVRDGLAGDVSDEQRQYLDIVINRADDLGIMVDDMLDISKLEAGILRISRRECRIDEIIERVRTTLERKAAIAEASLTFEIDPDLPEVYCDPEKIGRVLINLVVNAIKFCKEGGTIRVRARRSATDPTVGFDVTDNGPGIAPENLKLIFDRFKQIEGTIRQSTKGFGLGLNIARELAHLNFGDITVRSEPGHGSTFSFTVPCSKPEQLIQRYLDRLPLLCKTPATLSLLTIHAGDTTDTVLLQNAQQFLQRQSRHTDLILRLRPGYWLMVTVAGEDCPESRGDTMQAAWQEAGTTRDPQSSNELTFVQRGTWRVNDDLNVFRNIFAAECNVMEPCPA